MIFDLSLGGVITGEFKIDEIRPEWVGAKGDYYTDDTLAFKNAMILCAKRRKLRLGSKQYTVRETILNNSRGIVGSSKYIDGGNNGTRINFDPLDTTTDLLPCIKIQDSGAGAVFENFRVVGKVNYSSRYLGNWINKNYFDQDRYEMFSPGSATIEVAASATPSYGIYLPLA